MTPQTNIYGFIKGNVLNELRPDDGWKTSETLIKIEYVVKNLFIFDNRSIDS